MSKRAGELIYTEFQVPRDVLPQEHQVRHTRLWILQEGHNPSHDNGPRALRGLVTCFKEANWIDSLFIRHDRLI
jgi:hypothetical protein